MFNANRRFDPHANQSAEWNRGAYLVEALAHCGECHTPRNLFQALDNRRKFAGAVTGGWRAYNITSDTMSGVGSWTEAALAHYLATGHAEGRGTAAGPMGEAVELSLVHLTGEDIAAMVAYLRTITPIANPNLPEPEPHPTRSPGMRPERARPSTGRADLCGSLCKLPRMDGQEPDLRLRDDRRRALGQRSVRRQCRAGHPVRRRAPAGRSGDGGASLRRRLF